MMMFFYSNTVIAYVQLSQKNPEYFGGIITRFFKDLGMK
jgi:hypothetical protein